MAPDKYEAVVRKKVAKFKAHSFSSVGFTHGQLTRRAFLQLSSFVSIFMLPVGILVDFFWLLRVLILRSSNNRISIINDPNDPIVAQLLVYTLFGCPDIGRRRGPALNQSSQPTISNKPATIYGFKGA